MKLDKALKIVKKELEKSHENQMVIYLHENDKAPAFAAIIDLQTLYSVYDLVDKDDILHWTHGHMEGSK